MILCSMPPSLQTLAKGQLLSLVAEYKHDLVYILGRIRSHCLAYILGMTALPMVMLSSRLAYLVLRQGHERDYKKGFRVAVTASRDIKWDSVSGSSARSGTTWTFSLVGCPLAEHIVGLVKETLLYHLYGNQSLDFCSSTLCSRLSPALSTAAL
jgi:hypothetical protein